MKNGIANMTDLDERIKQLEALQAVQLTALKIQSRELMEDLKPSALLKTAFKDVVSSKAVKSDVMNTSIGMGAGWVARKLFTFNSKNLFRKVAGYALQYITTNLVTKKIPAIKDKIINS